MTSTTWIRSKRLTLALAMGISAIGLVGCGDGSNSNGTNVSVGAPAGVSLTKFVVENKSGYDIKALRLLNAAGKPLTNAAQSGAPFSCTNGSTCDFRASMQEAGLIQFYNSQNKLVAVDIIIKAPGEQQQVSTSAYTLGLFLFNELRNRYPDGAQGKLRKLNRFFENYEGVATGEANKFEALGQYYRQQTLTKGVDDDTFFKELNARLLANEVLPANQFSMKTASLIGQVLASLNQVEIISSAHAEERSSCPNRLTSTLSIASLFAAYIPGGSLVHEMVSVGCEIAKTEPDYSKEFKEINTKLDDIQKTVDTIYAGVNEGIDQTAMQGVRSNLTSIEQTVNKVETPLDVYKNLIVGKGSLKALIESNKSNNLLETRGPFQITWEKSEALPTLLGGRQPITDWNALKDLNISNQRDNIVTSLNTLCQLKAREEVNRIDRIAQCNAAVVNYQALVLKTYLKSMAMYKDISDTISYYKANGTKADKAFLEKHFIWKEYNYEKDLLPALQKGLSQATAPFVSNSDLAIPGSDRVYFDPLGGLPSKLVARLKDPALQCLDKDGKTPNVSDWRYNNDDSYIEVICKDPGAKYGAPIGSHYYYTNDNAHQPVNLMGVLVPTFSERMVRKIDEGCDNGTFCQNINNVSIKLPVAWGSASSTESEEDGKLAQGSSEFSGRITSKGVEKTNRVLYAAQSNGGWVGHVYMRLQDAKGLSYVAGFGMTASDAVAGRVLNKPYLYEMWFYMLCLNQSKCSVHDGDSNSKSKADALSFKNGPSIFSSHEKDGDTLNITFSSSK